MINRLPHLSLKKSEFVFDVGALWVGRDVIGEWKRRERMREMVNRDIFNYVDPILDHLLRWEDLTKDPSYHPTEECFLQIVGESWVRNQDFQN